jgi:formate dehydrogenase iron-sulfur subunit
VATGFLTDTTVCIGCKACEVACKQWNQLPADGYELTGDSYDNTKQLSGTTWRHVAFIENPKKRRLTGDVDLVALAEDVTEPLPGGAELDALGRWAFMSDVCKHCVEAPCQQACPTGSIIRNEFDNVYIQPDICNGCGYCVPACPYGVITQVPHDGRAFKCTLCYDRQRDGLEPACAKAWSGYRSSTTKATAGPTSGARLRWGGQAVSGATTPSSSSWTNPRPTTFPAIPSYRRRRSREEP